MHHGVPNQPMFATSTDAKLTWLEVGSGIACDSSAGEVNLAKSSTRVSNLQQCKKSCADTAGCQSITLFKNGWCSHYSTSCSKTTRFFSAVAFRLGEESDTTTTTTAACSQCGAMNNGKPSCCGIGGEWRGQCGESGDTNFPHTWIEGIKACKTATEGTTPPGQRYLRGRRYL